MPNTTDSVCPHCGRPLKPRTVPLAGTMCKFGYEPCDCPEAAEERRKEECQEKQDADRRKRQEFVDAVKKSGIPPAYYNARHDDAQALADKIGKGHGLYIQGPQGTHKTVLAAAIGRILIARGKRVRFEVASDLAEAMKSFEKEDEARSAAATGAPVLILDDLDKVNGSPYACDRFFSLINYRYNHLLPTIVTANVPEGGIARKFSDGEAGRAIASRLVEMTECVKLDGPDQRLVS